MPRERLDRAPKLRAIFNVETNFLPNIDYKLLASARHPRCSARPRPSPRRWPRAALAMAIDLARGITAADRAFRAGTETLWPRRQRRLLHVRRRAGRADRLRRSRPRAARGCWCRSATRSRSTTRGCRTDLIARPRLPRRVARRGAVDARAWCSSFAARHEREPGHFLGEREFELMQPAARPCC